MRARDKNKGGFTIDQHVSVFVLISDSQSWQHDKKSGGQVTDCDVYDKITYVTDPATVPPTVTVRDNDGMPNKISQMWLPLGDKTS